MRNGMIIIDADGHALDQERMYRERLPEGFRRRTHILGGGDGFERRQNGAIPYPEISPQGYVKDCDRLGIDVMVLYPTGGLSYTRLRERDYSIAFAETYNGWIAEFCAANPKRLKAVCITPLHKDVSAAIKELERAKKLGLVGVMVHTFLRDHNVGQKEFWPFYEACADLGMAVGFHSQGSDAMDPVCHFDTLLAMHTFSHAPEQLLACAAIMYSGVLEQFPKLRVAFLEAGAGWVPFWMEHMDGEWSKRKVDAPRLKMPPSEYIRSGRVFVSCEPEEKTLTYVAQWLGEDNIIFPSDYPHWDGAANTVDELMDRTDVPAQLKQKIFHDNPQRLYDFTVDRADFMPQALHSST